jgi:ADP-ribose pyrophosphatase
MTVAKDGERSPGRFSPPVLEAVSEPRGRLTVLSAGAPVDEPLVTDVLRSIQTVPRPEVLSTNVLHRSRIFAVVEQALRLPSGRTVVHQVVHHPGAVVIIPQLADGRLMPIAQYRFAAGETLLESQAGTFEPSEVPLACGRRELIEETGYRADHWCPMGTIYASPGFCDEMQPLFVASGLVPAHGAADEHEILAVKQLSVEEIEQAIASRAFVDVKSIAAYTRAKLQGVLGGMSA